jgi:diguanylate cyclase (GGDEF)-like protein
VAQSDDRAAHVLRARRTAAVARVALASFGIFILLGWPDLVAHRWAATAGFAFIVATSAVQLVAPRLNWLQVEESVAGLAGVLIIGLGGQRVDVTSVLWLAAVASGVLARGGRVHWIGRLVVLSALAMPMVIDGTVQAQHVGLCIAAIGLLLTCGRLTTELRDLLDQARHDADHDHLTGLLSRSAFTTRLTSAVDACRTEPVALLLVDLDDFGQVNKLQGHATGDQLLRATAERLREVAGAHDLARLGGDEFAVLLPAREADGLASAIVATLAAQLDGGAMRASIGAAVAPTDADDADTLLRAADVALRVAKRSGKAQISRYAGESFSDSGPTGARGALQRLIAGDGVVMFAQPIVEIADGSVHAYEALARFQTRGTDSPLHWFALADEFGLRTELELACLRAALDLYAFRPTPARLTVNVSGPVLLDPRAQALLAAVEDPSALIVEITEEAVVYADAELERALAPLLERGVRLAIDDMGAGYSGLRQITALRPTYLKLDRSLITGIDTDLHRAALVEALVGYANRTSGMLVAEGVETEAELRTVAELGVPLVQGWLYGRAAPPWAQPISAPAPRDASRASAPGA